MSGSLTVNATFAHACVMLTHLQEYNYYNTLCLCMLIVSFVTISS